MTNFDPATTTYASRSFSFSSRIGEDGKPIVRESRTTTVGAGDWREEHFSNVDHSTGHRESGTLRSLGDRSVITRSISNGSKDSEISTESKGFKGDAGMRDFEHDWQEKAGPLLRLNTKYAKSIDTTDKSIGRPRGNSKEMNESTELHCHGITKPNCSTKGMIDNLENEGGRVGYSEEGGVAEVQHEDAPRTQSQTASGRVRHRGRFMRIMRAADRAGLLSRTTAKNIAAPISHIPPTGKAARFGDDPDTVFRGMGKAIDKAAETARGLKPEVSSKVSHMIDAAEEKVSHAVEGIAERASDKMGLRSDTGRVSDPSAPPIGNHKSLTSKLADAGEQMARAMSDAEARAYNKHNWGFVQPDKGSNPV